VDFTTLIIFCPRYPLQPPLRCGFHFYRAAIHPYIFSQLLLSM
jgi:hypothetical protein